MVASSFFIALLLLGCFCYGSLNYAGKVSGSVSRESILPQAEENPTEEVLNQKTEKKEKVKFYLRISEDGEVEVYQKDGTTLYEKTGIRKENIPVEEVEKLQKGYAVKNKKELYSILENFSS
jgi:hypothetical protein